MARSSKAAVASTARQAVAIEATGPNSSDCSRRDAMSARQSAPSAMATARWVRTTPGSWVCHLIPQPAMAPDIASVRPLRSASSDSNAVPAWDTKFFPSTVTFIERVARLFCTFKESSSSWLVCCVETHILPGQEDFYADASTIESGAGRIIEAKAAGRRQSPTRGGRTAPARGGGEPDEVAPQDAPRGADWLTWKRIKVGTGPAMYG